MSTVSRYIVATSTRPPIAVDAPNWLAAMALGIAELADAETIDRLVCETLPNGNVIARDARRGTAYIIRREGALEADEPRAGGGGEGAPSEEDELLAMGEDTEDDEFSSLVTAVSEDLEVSEEDSQVIDRLGAILASGGVIEAWDAALELAGELVACEAGSAMQLTERETLRFVSVFGPDSGKLLGVELASDMGIVGFCTRQRLGLLIKDAATDERHYQAVDQHTGFHTHSVLCAPVAMDSVTYGCIELLNAEGADTFSREQLDAVSMIADSLAERLSAR